VEIVRPERSWGLPLRPSAKVPSALTDKKGSPRHQENTYMRFVTRESIQYKAAPYGFIAEIPAGTPCIPATNLPDDHPVEAGKTLPACSRFWACEWPAMTAEAESWERNYGFLLDASEVREIPEEPTGAEGEAITHRAMRGKVLGADASGPDGGHRAR
jgi:hypothetical protein